MKISKTKRILLLMTCVFFLATLLLSGIAYGESGTVTITKTPFLSFIDVPDSAILTTQAVQTANLETTSDIDGTLPTERHLTVRDTRNCGGINLQLQADPFLPLVSPALRDNLRIVSSATTSLSCASTTNGICYLTGFAGDNSAADAPLNVAATTFSDPTLFTATPFDTVDNILDSPIDILEGPLTAPTGRNGSMHFSLSFYIVIPKFYPPGTYYSTLTYTLSDDTSGVCP